MKKKILSAVCALVLVFSSAAALPEGFAKTGSAITASAETYGDYEYTVLDDGTVKIGAYIGSDEEVTIPSTIDGKKVTSIGEWAFSDCTSLASVTIPNSVTSIGPSAFGIYWDEEVSDFSKVDGFTIYGYKGSTAETYAKENGFKFVELQDDTRKKGDLNDNGKIDASDLLQVKSHIKKVKPLEGDDFTCADVDGNGAINAADLLKMKAHMKGVSSIWG